MAAVAGLTKHNASTLVAAAPHPNHDDDVEASPDDALLQGAPVAMEFKTIFRAHDSFVQGLLPRPACNQARQTCTTRHHHHHHRTHC